MPKKITEPSDLDLALDQIDQVISVLRAAALSQLAAKLETVKFLLEGREKKKGSARRGKGKASEPATRAIVLQLRIKQPRWGIRTIAKRTGLSKKVVESILSPQRRTMDIGTVITALRRPSTKRPA